MPLSQGRVIFIRWVSARGTIKILGQTVNLSRRYKQSYAKAVLDTRHERLTGYVARRVVKRGPYKLIHK